MMHASKKPRITRRTKCTPLSSFQRRFFAEYIFTSYSVCSGVANFLRDGKITKAKWGETIVPYITITFHVHFLDFVAIDYFAIARQEPPATQNEQLMF